MEKFIKIILGLISFGGTIVTYISGYNEVCDYMAKYKIPSWLTTSVLSIFGFITVLLIPILIYKMLCLCTLKYRKRIGTHQIPCSFYRMVQYKFNNKNNTLLYEVHKNLYHQCFSLKKKIRNNEFSNEKALKEAMANFLAVINGAIYKIFGIDLTINIKKIDADAEGNLILSPYIHCKGNQDVNSPFDRNFNYQYILLGGNSNDITLYTGLAVDYNTKNGNSQYKVNSIFSYLLDKDKNTCWMSNDLSIDSKNKIFYTSSDNYMEHYNSLAVFKIIQPENKTIPKGIIVFDSHDPYKFSEAECKLFMGFVAHLFYEIFDEVENK